MYHIITVPFVNAVVTMQNLNPISVVAVRSLAEKSVDFLVN